jgi:gamma-glutamyl:cysteine ligase YbdK (ATP-grasp superfamily)
MRRHWIAVENKWLATRYGLGAMYIRTPGGKRRPLRKDANDLIQRLLPIARENGDEDYLAALLPLEQFETGAERQRRLYRDAGNWQALMADMTERLSQELDAVPQNSTNQPEKNAAQAGGRAVPTGTARPPLASPQALNGDQNDD